MEVVQINWEKKKELVESGEIDCIMGCFSMEGRLDDYRWAGPYIASRQVVAVNENSDIYKLSDLEGKNLAVQSTTKPEGIFLNRTDEYNFVRDEILFGYNVDDSIPASKILSDGYGQCNTKGTLFMALLRACNIPCRIHGFTIDKKLQKGTMTGIVYKSAPKNIFHSWIEVYFENIWYELEAFILDSAYLNNLQKKYPDCTGSFCGYGVAVKNFQNPIIDFNRNSTYIQSEGITQDFGIYDSPDDLLKEHQQELSVLKAFIYRNLGRRLMNRNVMKLRKS